jgi:hypothetical protein
MNRIQGIDSAYVAWRAGPVRQIGLSYRPARLDNRFLGSLKGLQIRAPARGRQQATYAGGIDSLESISGLLKSLKIRALKKGAKRLLFSECT